MNDTFSDDATTTEWCCGLPGAGSQLLTMPERKALQQEARRQLLIGLLLAIVPPLLFIVGMIAIANPDLNKTQSIGPVLILGCFVLVALLFLTARDFRKRAKQLRLDLREGYKKYFVGKCTRDVIEHPDVKKLLDLHLIHDFTELRVEVLPNSKRLWRVNGHPLSEWVSTSWSSTVNLPEIAGIAANWLNPNGQLNRQNVGIGRRELTEAEKLELQRYAKGIQKRFLWPATLFTLFWFFPLAGFFIFSGKWPDKDDIASFILIALATIINDFKFISNYFKARTILRDVANGLVEIFQLSAQTSLSDGDSSFNAAEEDIFEQLPISNLLWSKNGQPAEWRKRWEAGKR